MKLKTETPNNLQPEPGGIYIHIPFCVRKCAYCGFYSVSDPSLKPAFVRALIREMHMAADWVRFACDTLYMGGGTPSALEPHYINRIIDTARQCFTILPDAEISIEANPGTVTPRTLADYGRAGVNRINIGVQSFQNENLAFLGRIHSAEEAEQALRWAREAGFGNIGLDLIYGLPSQSEAAWLEDLEQAVALAPEHLSCYMLTYEPGTPLDRRRCDGEFKPSEEALVGDLFEITVAFLEAHGYEQYEISNFARSESVRSRHNRKYWSLAPYIGLGPSAHSFIPPERFWNPSSVADYLKVLESGTYPTEEREHLTREQQIIEAFYVGLRTVAGIDIAAFEQRFGLSFERVFGGLVNDLKEKGLLRADKARCALSRQGMRFQDSITAMFVGQDFS